MKTLWIICYFQKLWSASTTQFRTIVPKPCPYFCQDALIYMAQKRSSRTVRNSVPCPFPGFELGQNTKKEGCSTKNAKNGGIFPNFPCISLSPFRSFFISTLYYSDVPCPQKMLPKTRLQLADRGDENGVDRCWLRRTQNLRTSLPNA